MIRLFWGVSAQAHPLRSIRPVDPILIGGARELPAARAERFLLEAGSPEPSCQDCRVPARS